MSSHLRTFLLGTVHVDRQRIELLTGVRAAVLTAIVLAAAVYAGQPRNGIPLALGLLFVAIAESGESVGRRWRTMLWTTLWLMAAVLIAGLLSDYVVGVLIGSAIVAFGAGLAGAAGPRAAMGGVLTLVIFIIFAGAPELPDTTLESTLLIGLGGLIITVATVLPAIIRNPAVIRIAVEPVPPMWPRIRQHINERDAFLRHGVRLAVAIPIASAIALATPFPHSYWLPMTIAWVTKADAEGTVTRVAARVAGTVIGVGICALVLEGLGVSSYGAAVISALAGGLAVAFIWANYAIGVVGITMLVLILFSLDGDSVTEDLLVRLGATLLAAVIAVIASFIWRAPSAK